jgi:hypothetical protein
MCYKLTIHVNYANAILWDANSVIILIVLMSIALIV